MISGQRLVRVVRAALGISLVLTTFEVQAAAQPLTRERLASLVLDAPAGRVARSEVAVAAAAVESAAVVGTENPVISGLGGARFNPDGGRALNAVGSLAWPIELGGERRARVGAAKSGLAAAGARAQQEQRQLLLAALLQHACVLRDERQLEIATERHALSQRLVLAAQRRKAAGSVPEIDVALASLQERREASVAASAVGERDNDRLALTTMLGVADDTAVSGVLVPEEAVPPLPALLASVERQLEVRSAAATVGALQARAERERAARMPTLSLLAQYERDDEANIGMIGLSLPIPILNANRAEVATSSAEVVSARARLELVRTNVRGHLKALYARFLASRAVVDTLRPAAAVAMEAVKLATRGYELGENDLASVLLVRREAVEADAALLSAQYTHAAVKLELLVASGRLPQ